MPGTPPGNPWVTMKRQKQHRIALNRLVKDVRIMPNRLLLAEMLMMWMDSEGEERTFVQGLLTASYGDPKRVRWNDPEDPLPQDPGGRIEKDAAAEIKGAFAFLEKDADTPSNN